MITFLNHLDLKIIIIIIMQIKKRVDILKEEKRKGMDDFGNTETEKKREEKTGKSKEGEESTEKKKTNFKHLVCYSFY